MRRVTLLLVSFSLSFLLSAQSLIVSGPMLGPVELRDAKIWVELSPSVRSASIRVTKKGEKNYTEVTYQGELQRPFNPIQFAVGGLEPNTTYQYQLWVNGKPSDQEGTFTTKPLWQWRSPAPDFSFLAGSCSYINDPAYDRPGTPYGSNDSIFLAMAREQASFMFWLGDAWYTREVDYYSEWGLWNRASHDRSTPTLQPLLKAMSHIAIWDDHDYGPNNMGSSYHLKETSRKVFNSYFCNPSSGMNGQGIYTQYSYGDADLFLLDDRWWRSADNERDSINGKPNPNKTMIGREQLDWLKTALLSSNAPFKIIGVGSQVLNPVSPFDRWLDFPAEYYELMNFLQAYSVNGVVFLTGDRHHSEIIKVDRPGTYPLYDITVSPLTSATHVFGGPEKNNPYRVLGVDQKHNYGKISISGPRGARVLKVEYLGTKGELLGTWSVGEKELRTPKK
ncbi:MAG: alkaline phosphatase family protein [Sphingomonadales bacterium]|nr:alkaline phosphatase family protein [Sphingomonadales bacterium]